MSRWCCSFNMLQHETDLSSSEERREGEQNEVMTWGVGEGWHRKQSVVSGEDGLGEHVF